MIRRAIRTRLLAGAAIAAAFTTAAAAQDRAETASYTIRAMTQDFDGEREFSQTQALAYARMRQGNESWIELDFGDGAVVIENAEGTSAGRFANLSGVDAGLRYNYTTRELADGGSRVQRYHNTFVRPKLGASPALGANAKWNVSLTPAELGVEARSDAPIKLEMSREYFVFQGRDYVLLHYRVPAFTYTAEGTPVVQWGEGAALTDPGFGKMYWNAALHRAVGEEAGSSGRPYRRMKTLVALDPAGRPMVDPRVIPQVAAIVARLDGAGARDVLGFIDGEMPNRIPLLMAQALDIMALSIAEDSPNQLGELTSQITNGDMNGVVFPMGSQVRRPDGRSMSEMLNEFRLIGEVLAGEIERRAAAGEERRPPDQVLEGLLSQVNDLAARYQNEIHAADPASADTLDQVLTAVIKDSNWYALKLDRYTDLKGIKRVDLPPTFQQKLGAAISSAAQAIDNLVSARERRFAEAIERQPWLEKRKEVLAALQAEVERTYAAAHSDREAILAQEKEKWLASGTTQISDADRQRLNESADLLYRKSRSFYRLAEEYRREAKRALEEQSQFAELEPGARGMGTPELVASSRARVPVGERFVAEASRYFEYAERAGYFEGGKFETGDALRLKPLQIGADSEQDETASADNGAGGARGADGARGGGGAGVGARVQTARPLTPQELAAAETERQLRERALLQFGQRASARREADQRAREDRLQRARDRNLKISPLETSSLTIAPVSFNSPDFDPPVYNPPVWVPPEFDPPEITAIDWTNFDDDDYPGSGTNLAFGFGSMSGTVATDLSRWAEWLATQDVRQLERLARQIGYPNLASALADARNIMADAANQGYRQWAMQPPSCGGLIGCGPSYLERWAAKRSRVALGNILNDSRAVFSSGGLSDIGISGLQLLYLLRDFGLQDGDIVDIKITQFGRTLFENRLSLLNAGTNFSIPLRRGVAQLTITAVNEGAVSPNTAEIEVEEVLRGDATQTYSLRTGEVATLRIEAGARE